MTHTEQLLCALHKNAAAIKAVKRIPKAVDAFAPIAQAAGMGLTGGVGIGGLYLLYNELNKRNGTPLLPQLLRDSIIQR